MRYDPSTNTWSWAPHGGSDLLSAAALYGREGREAERRPSPACSSSAFSPSASPAPARSKREEGKTAALIQTSNVAPHRPPSALPLRSLTVSGQHRVRICWHSAQDSGTAGSRHVLLLPETMDELLDAGSRKLRISTGNLGFTARRVFTEDGYEVMHPEEVLPDETLVFTAGEDFCPLLRPATCDTTVSTGGATCEARKALSVPTLTLIDRLRMCEAQLGLAPAASIGVGLLAAQEAALLPLEPGLTLAQQLDQLCEWVGIGLPAGSTPVHTSDGGRSAIGKGLAADVASATTRCEAPCGPRPGGDTQVEAVRCTTIEGVGGANQAPASGETDASPSNSARSDAAEVGIISDTQLLEVRSIHGDGQDSTKSEVIVIEGVVNGRPPLSIPPNPSEAENLLEKAVPTSRRCSDPVTDKLSNSDHRSQHVRATDGTQQPSQSVDKGVSRHDHIIHESSSLAPAEEEEEQEWGDHTVAASVVRRALAAFAWMSHLIHLQLPHIARKALGAVEFVNHSIARHCIY